MTKEKFFKEVEKIADEVFHNSVSDPAAEFETLTYEFAKQNGLIQLWLNSFDILNEIYYVASFRAWWRNLTDEEILQL